MPSEWEAMSIEELFELHRLMQSVLREKLIAKKKLCWKVDCATSTSRPPSPTPAMTRRLQWRAFEPPRWARHPTATGGRGQGAPPRCSSRLTVPPRKLRRLSGQLP
jgi:hypothetical protein